MPVAASDENRIRRPLLAYLRVAFPVPHSASSTQQRSPNRSLATSFFPTRCRASACRKGPSLIRSRALFAPCPHAFFVRVPPSFRELPAFSSYTTTVAVASVRLGEPLQRPQAGVPLLTHKSSRCPSLSFAILCLYRSDSSALRSSGIGRDFCSRQGATARVSNTTISSRRLARGYYGIPEAVQHTLDCCAITSRFVW